MANDISGYLAQILSAVKGEDVRQAIHDAIERCYTDGTWPETGNTVDLQARQQIASILDHMTGTPGETLLFPETENDVPPTYPSSSSADTGSPIYGLRDFSLNADPSSFDFIRVYYQVVRQPTSSPAYNSAPIIFEFTSDDFLNATSVISGYNYGTANQHLRIRRMDIKQDSQNYPPTTADNRKRFTVSNASYWTWDGDKGSDAVTAEVDPASNEANVYPAGAILKIVGINYASVTEAVNSYMETAEFVDTTARAEIEELRALIGQGGSGGGMSAESQAALLELLKRLAYQNPTDKTYYDAFEDSLTNRTVVSISATFNQGTAIVKDTDALSTLSQYLTVTARYDDNTSGSVTGYTLSGTLTEGNSTITVHYQGKTATFTVYVSSDTLYSITNRAMTSSDLIEIPLDVVSQDVTYSIAMDVDIPDASSTTGRFRFFWAYPSTYSEGVHVGRGGGSALIFRVYNTSENIFGYSTNIRSAKMVMTHVKSSNMWKLYYSFNGGTMANTNISATFTAYTSTPIKVGSPSASDQCWTGTINRLKVLDRAMTTEEIESFISGS